MTFTKDRLDKMVRDAATVAKHMLADSLASSVCVHVKALAEEVERLRDRQRNDEDQLVRIAGFLGKDARHAPDSDRTIAGLAIAEIQRLQAVVDRLQPYEQMAQFDERRRQREAEINSEIAAGIRCGGGIVGCTGGPNCTSDHK